MIGLQLFSNSYNNKHKPADEKGHQLCTGQSQAVSVPRAVCFELQMIQDSHSLLYTAQLCT